MVFRFLFCQVFLAFGKESLPSITLDKGFAEWKKHFIEFLGHSAKNMSPVMSPPKAPSIASWKKSKGSLFGELLLEASQKNQQEPEDRKRSFYWLIFYIFLSVGSTSQEKLHDELHCQSNRMLFLKLLRKIKGKTIFPEEPEPELKLAKKEPYQRSLSIVYTRLIFIYHKRKYPDHTFIYIWSRADEHATENQGSSSILVSSTVPSVRMKCRCSL